MYQGYITTQKEKKKHPWIYGEYTVFGGESQWINKLKGKQNCKLEADCHYWKK